MSLTSKIYQWLSLGSEIIDDFSFSSLYFVFFAINNTTCIVKKKKKSQVILRQEREHQANKLFVNSTKTELASPCVMCQERNKRAFQTFSHTHTHVCVCFDLIGGIKE